MSIQATKQAGHSKPALGIFALTLMPILALGSMSITACKKKLGVERTTTAYIIGPDNIIPVDDNVTSQVSKEPVRASVLISTKLTNKRVKFCSGTLIAPEKGSSKLRVLTNHHCFAKTDSDGKALPDLMIEACSGTVIYFGFVPNAADETQQARCEAGSLRTDFNGDLGVLTLASNPPDEYQPASFWDGDDAPVGRDAFIIHYPDIQDQLALPPGGQIKLPTAQATLDDCKTIGPFDVSEWDLDRTLPFALRHTCDLIHGSSGSGLFDRNTNKLLGVNWGGLKVTYEEGTRIDNVATKISYALAFLNFDTETPAREAQLQRESNAEAVQKDQDKAKKKESSFAAGVKKARCGSVGPTSGGPHSMTTMLGFLALLFLPLTVVAARQKPAKPVMICLAWLTIVGLTSVAASVASAASAAWNAPAAWSTTYLLNTLLVSELEAVQQNEASPKADTKKLAQRAAFAINAAKSKKQQLTPSLKQKPSVSAGKRGELFNDSTLNTQWQVMALAYDQPAPRCALSVSEIRAFIATQRQQRGDQRTPSADELLRPLQGWSLDKIQCLIFALTALTPQEETLPLLLAIDQRRPQKDLALRTMLALRYFELQRYDESLRILVELQDANPAFRLPYEIVQRIYSLRQRGPGSVALRNP